MRSGTRLTQSIRLLNLRPKPLLNRINELFGERRCSGRNHPQTREIIVINKRGFGEVEDDGRSDVCIRNPVVLYNLAEEFEVEGGHHNCGDAGVGWKVDEALEACSLTSVSSRFNTRFREGESGRYGP